MVNLTYEFAPGEGDRQGSGHQLAPNEHVLLDATKCQSTRKIRSAADSLIQCRSSKGQSIDYLDVPR